MAEYNVYCDESRHTSDPADRFAVIGALQCPREEKHRLVGELHRMQSRFNAHGELGWKRVSPNREAFYQELISLFVNEASLRFRCIIVDRESLDHEIYNQGDAELGFYKLYYQMLVHWLDPSNDYYLYLDWQQNKQAQRFVDLRTVLMRKLSGRAKIVCLEPVESHTQPLVQLVDLLMGAVGYQWNRRGAVQGASQVKTALAQQLADSLERETLASGTARNEQKFNIFHWQGRSR